MNYLPPFDSIRRSVEIHTVRGELRVNIPYQEFIKLLRLMMTGIEVNEAWYLGAYDDIATAVEAGGVASARDHFLSDGYFEGRLPFPIKVDEAWYLQQNPDVEASVRTGAVASAQAHFDAVGYREGRLPFKL